MKYIKKFVDTISEKNRIITQEDIETIEDIFLSYFEGIDKKFPFTELKDGDNVMNKLKTEGLNYYYFTRMIKNKFKIGIWSASPLTQLILPKMKERLHKFGFDVYIDSFTRSCFGESKFQDKDGRIIKSDHIVGEYKIIISK